MEKTFILLDLDFTVLLSGLSTFGILLSCGCKTLSLVRHKSNRTCRNSLWRQSRFLQQVFLGVCSESDSVSARKVSFSHIVCLPEPAPPSSLTSTAPLRLWEDISQPQRYSLSGNSHIAPGVLPLLCLFLPRLCLRPLCQPGSNLPPHSNGSVIADYMLTFIMPEEEQDLLKNFTLSRDMVFNVFRQFLYEQNLQETESMYIERSSLRMLSSR